MITRETTPPLRTGLEKIPRRVSAPEPNIIRKPGDKDERSKFKISGKRMI